MSKRQKARTRATPVPGSFPSARVELPRPARRFGLAQLAGGALIACAVLFAYWPAIHGGFIWDDLLLLVDSPLIHASDGLSRLWLTTEAPDYWPLTSTTFWLEWRLFGLDPTGYHVTNLALHVAESLLAWLILARLRVPGAFLAALVFAVHPVNVESVAWIAQRKNLVALLFFLLSILAYLASEDDAPADRPSRSPARRWYALSLGLFVLAMLGKGSVATLPATLVLFAWWRRGRVTRRDLLRILPFVVVAAALVAVNVWFQTHGTGPIRELTLLQRLLGAGAVVWFYLGKALLPIGLSFVYPQWDVDPGRLAWWLPLFAAGAVSLVLLRSRDARGRPFFVAWCYFCVALLPVMGLTDVYFMTFSLVADHYQHVAILGALALAAAGWSRWRSGPGVVRRYGGLAAAALLVGAFTLLSARQSASYRDAETLYRATIARNPDCWLCQYNLAVELDAKGSREEAFGHLQEAVRIRPDYAEAHNNLSLALSARGRRAEALAHAEQAVRYGPRLAEARVNLGILLSQAGRSAEALPLLEEAVRLRPGSEWARYNLGLALTGVGRGPEGVSELEEALRLQPHSAETLGALGLALVRSGRPEEAMPRYEQALRLDPDYAEAHYNLGTLLAGAGRGPEARGHFEQALRVRPGYAEAHNNLGVLLEQAGLPQEALAHFEAAVRAAPGFLAARMNCAETNARLGRFREAIAHAEVARDESPPEGRSAIDRKLEAWRALVRTRGAAPRAGGL